jgi:hypothetical protein
MLWYPGRTLPALDLGDEVTTGIECLLTDDGVAKGNTCVAVPAGADGLWTVSTGILGKPVFFTAK